MLYIIIKDNNLKFTIMTREEQIKKQLGIYTDDASNYKKLYISYNKKPYKEITFEKLCNL